MRNYYRANEMENQERNQAILVTEHKICSVISNSGENTELKQSGTLTIYTRPACYLCIVLQSQQRCSESVIIKWHI